MIPVKMLGFSPTTALAPTTTALLAFSPIQDVRDATQAAFNSPAVRATVASLVVSLVSSGGLAAWRAGSSFRLRARAAPLAAPDWALLLACLLVDAIGDATFVLPGGEQDDLLWAPLSGLMVLSMFGSDRLAFLCAFKELLPLADLLPAATLGWLLRYGFPSSAMSQVFGVNPTLSLDDVDDES